MLIKFTALTLLPTEFLPYEPQPSVNEGKKELYTSPIPPNVDGEFQITRIALTRSPKVFANSAFCVWIAAEWPKPWKFTIASANSKPCSVLLDFNNASTGESFSRVSGSPSPTKAHSAKRMLVFGGTVKPACSAIHAAGLPTTAAFNFAPAQFSSWALSTPKMYFSSKAFSFLFTK